jgi:6-phosphogluconolactonase
MIRIFNDLETLSQAAAEMFVELASQAVSATGRFSVALSGGETPRRTYEILASVPMRAKMPWEATHVFWGDERCVPSGDPRSNYLMARQVLLDHVPVHANHIHPIRGDMPPVQAAARYEQQLRAFFSGGQPVFDLILLGMGANAHTASLFPHTHVLDEGQRWVAEVYLADQDMFRVTLTAPLINRANEAIFLVSGAEKASVLQGVLEGAYQPHELPAQLIRPKGAHPIWLVDKAAAHKLVAETVESA